MVIYTYTNKAVSPDSVGIHVSVGLSLMTNKSISHCNWNEDTGLLDIIWHCDLSLEDKMLLDEIVANNSAILKLV